MRAKNWDKFQHFKNRRPPWIKLHREILDQRDINMISDCSFRVLIGVWLLASEDADMAGNIPPIDDIAFRLRMDKSKVIKALAELKPWIEQDDIKMISERYQVDDPETERETEKEKEKETETEGKQKKSVTKFIKPTMIEIRRYCEEYEININPVKFFDFYESNGWKVGKNPMKDWKAAARNWSRQ